MNQRYAAIFAMLFLLTVCCGCQRQASLDQAETENTADIPLSKDFRITLERSRCFGACPAYRIEIFPDGKVLYSGYKYVSATGDSTYRISTEAVRQLIAAFEAADYFELEEKYETKVETVTHPDGTTETITRRPTDLPSTVTSINLYGSRKQVVNYFGAPEKLDRLEALIDQVAATEALVKRK